MASKLAAKVIGNANEWFSTGRILLLIHNSNAQPLLNVYPSERARNPMALAEFAFLKCVSATCQSTFDCQQPITKCPDCGNILDVEYEWEKTPVPGQLKDFQHGISASVGPLVRGSGVWRFHSMLPFASLDSVVSVGEGKTVLQQADGISSFAKMDSGKVFLQYEGLNPSGSFKDNGMCAAFTHARNVNAKTAACASTGNTSASLAMYAAVTKLLKSIVFIGSGKIAYGKLSQALDYGALTIQIEGDFDDAMRQVQAVCPKLGIYLVNSVNPFRLEGQKTIMMRVLEALDWQVPDWIVVPGGNLGNSSSFGKVFSELFRLGLIERIPRLAIVNASGASTLNQIYNEHGIRFENGKFDQTRIGNFFKEMNERQLRADTLASAIEINVPVNLAKCLRALEICDGVVCDVTDSEIMDAKAQVGRNGFGCEPASAASVAGLRKLRESQVISPSERVVCILTGHQLKDPDVTVAYHGSDMEFFESKLGSRGVNEVQFSNRPVVVANDTDAIVAAISSIQNES